MSSSTNLGSVSLSGNTPRLSGSASGLDTEKLVKALTDAKKFPATRYEQRVTQNDAKIKAFDDMKTMLSKMKDALEGLRNPPGYFSKKENLFEGKAAYFSADTTTSPSTLLGLDVTNDAQAGSFEVRVEQIAKAQKFSSDSITSTKDNLAGLVNSGSAFSGTMTLGLNGSGKSADIAIDGTMSLNDVRQAINAKSDDTGVTASVVKVTDSDFRLILTANETGKDVEISQSGTGDVLGKLGISTDGGTTLKNGIQVAQKAIIEVDGVDIQRDGNTIDDILDGVTFDLIKAEPGTKITVDIKPSLANAKAKIVEFVSAYNEFQEFVSDQSKVSSTGTVDEDAVLFGDSTLRTIAQGVSNAVTGQVTGLDDDAISSLAGIGITMDQDNKLKIDETKLDKLLISEPDKVRDVFEFRYKSSSADLALFARTDKLNDAEFTVAIVDANNDGVPESATIDGVAAEISGNSIKGADGTDYEGLELIWTGKGSTSIDITATKGVAEKLFNSIDDMVDDLSGTLKETTDALKDSTKQYNDEIQDIEERAETFRQRLVAKFAAMEAALSASQALLAQVQAQAKALSGGSN